jgi:hypothetical protein
LSQAKIKLRFAKIKTTLTEAAKTNFLPRKISRAAVIVELRLRVSLSAVRSMVVVGAGKNRIEGNALYEQIRKLMSRPRIYFLGKRETGEQ